MKMRRIVSLLVALGLGGLGPLPLSACALVSSQPSECATTQTVVHCEGMGMGQAERPVVTLSKASMNCCEISEAPLPEAQTWAGSFAVAATPTLAANAIVVEQLFETLWSMHVEQDSSPPPLQSLLCTFLI